MDFSRCDPRARAILLRAAFSMYNNMASRGLQVCLVHSEEQHACLPIQKDAFVRKVLQLGSLPMCKGASRESCKTA